MHDRIYALTLLKCKIGDSSDQELTTDDADSYVQAWVLRAGF
jgi:hypothetical protein